MLKIINRNMHIRCRLPLPRLLSSHTANPRKLAYIQRIGKQPLIYENLGQQFQKSVQKYGKRLAIKSHYDKRQLTYEEAYEEAAVLAVKLQKFGLKRGQHLAIWAPNTIQWFVTFLASTLSGYTLVCINPALQKPELEYALQKAKSKTLVTMDACGKLDFLSTLREFNDRELRVIMKTDQKVENFTNYDQWLHSRPTAQEIAQLKCSVGDHQPESPAVILFTSGTTGKPKCALISHYGMVNQAVNVGKVLKLETGPKTICLPAPMFHALAMSIITAALKYGSTLSIPSPTFSAEASLDAIERDKCNAVVGTPTMFVDMMDHQSRLPRNIESLDLAWMGGSSCTPELLGRVNNAFNLPDVRVAYGLSEATGAICSMDGTESPEDVQTCCGKMFEHSEAKVADENGKTLQFGETGELCVRGWFTMLGYFEDEENTKKTINVTGWLKTGDQFVLESNGILRYRGRKKELIIRGGENVFPKEIEDVIDNHPSVLESQVIGIPDDRLGEEICVYLRLKRASEPLTVDDIRAFCKDKLAYFKIPKYVRILEEFPKTTSGKIQKFKLQEMYRQDL